MRVVLFICGFGAIIIGMVGIALFLDQSPPAAICIGIAMFIIAINSFTLTYHLSRAKAKGE